MDRRHLAVALAVVAVGAIAAGPLSGTGAAHGNHVTATSQVVGDGEVVVESLFVTGEGFVVLHADDGGRPGPVIGTRSVSFGYSESVAVPVEDGALSEGSTRVWAVLYRDDGDGEFEPGEDERLQSFGSIAASTFRVRAGDGSARVVVPSDGSRRTDGALRVDRVDLPEDGHVVVHAVEGGGPGDPVGHRTLSAGTHHNVSVELDRSFYGSMPRSFAVLVSVYADDGDGEFDPAADTPVTVGGQRVMTRAGVRKADGSGSTTTTPLVNTPSATTADGGAGPTTATATNTTTTSGTPTSGSGGLPLPGFGAALAAAVLAGAALAVAARRRG